MISTNLVPNPTMKLAADVTIVGIAGGEVPGDQAIEFPARQPMGRAKVVERDGWHVLLGLLGVRVDPDVRPDARLRVDPPPRPGGRLGLGGGVKISSLGRVARYRDGYRWHHRPRNRRNIKDLRRWRKCCRRSCWPGTACQREQLRPFIGQAGSDADVLGVDGHRRRRETGQQGSFVGRHAHGHR